MQVLKIEIYHTKIKRAHNLPLTIVINLGHLTATNQIPAEDL